MNKQFGDIYLILNKKEKGTILFAMKSFHSEYPNIHLGQISFLNLNAVKYSMVKCLAYVKQIEEKKNKPPVSSKVCQSILNKLLVTFQSRLIKLDELKVKTLAKRFFNGDIYITYVPIFNGRISCRVELQSHSNNVFLVTTRQTHLNEALEQLTYKFGLWNTQ